MSGVAQSYRPFVESLHAGVTKKSTKLPGGWSRLQWSFAESNPHLTLAEIKRATAREFGIPIAAMRARNRFREYAWPRQVAMFLARERAAKSYPQIGRAFGRDHTTVLHAYKAVRTRMAGSHEYAVRIETLAHKLEADTFSNLPRWRQEMLVAAMLGDMAVAVLT